MRKKEKKGMPAAICVWIAVAVMIVIAAVITRNKLTWILQLLLIQVLIIYYTLPFMLDVPRLLTGAEERAIVVVVSGYDYRKENGAVLPPEVKVRNVEDGTEFRVHLFHGEIDAGECVQIEYLPCSKNARVIQCD